MRSGPYFFTGRSDIAAATALIRIKSNHFAATSSRFVVAGGMPDASGSYDARETRWTSSVALGRLARRQP